MNKRYSAKGKGQTLVEFAIILPVLAFIVIVIFDLGRAVYYYSMLTNAAREGARYGSVATTSTVTDIQQHVIAYLSAIDVQASNITVDKSNVTTVEVEKGKLYRDDINVVVTINYNFVPFTPYVDRLLNGGVINLTAKSQMAREYR